MSKDSILKHLRASCIPANLAEGEDICLAAKGLGTYLISMYQLGEKLTITDLAINFSVTEEYIEELLHELDDRGYISFGKGAEL